MSRKADPTYEMLEQIAAGGDVSQRRLASSLGLALGLTNSLLKGFVHRGWIKVTHVQPHRVRYFLTPAGLAEKVRLSQTAFYTAVDRYRDARTHVQAMFNRVSAEWLGDPDRKTVVFYGSGELAEIGFICLQETDLNLVAVVDTAERGKFFGVPVYPKTRAGEALRVAGPAACVLVMSTARTEALENELAALVDPGRVVVWFKAQVEDK